MEKKMENEMETGNILRIMGFRVSQNWGHLIGGLHNKDYSILGSISGSPILGNYQVCLWPKGQLSIPLFLSGIV